MRGFEKERWDEACFELVVIGNAAKFQHPALRSFLVGTGERVLVEASPHDAIWGIGLSASDAAASVPMEWKGQNLLGFALMKVRSHLRN